MNNLKRPRPSKYEITTPEQRKWVFELKKDEFSNKQIADITGIDYKTICSLTPYRKDMYRPIRNEIKQIYLEIYNIGEQIPTKEILKKKIRKIINTHKDKRLKKLIRQLPMIRDKPRKFDSTNKQVINRIAKEILNNQWNEENYSSNEEETQSDEESTYLRSESIENTNQDQEQGEQYQSELQQNLQNFQSNPEYFINSDSQMQGNSSFSYPNYNQKQQREQEQEQEQKQNWIKEFDIDQYFSFGNKKTHLEQELEFSFGESVNQTNYQSDHYMERSQESEMQMERKENIII